MSDKAHVDIDTVITFQDGSQSRIQTQLKVQLLLNRQQLLTSSISQRRAS